MTTPTLDRTQPTFPACPSWCTRSHDPYGEVLTHAGATSLAPRLHGRELYAGPVADPHFDGDVTVGVVVVRTDYGSIDDGSTETGLERITVTAVDADGLLVTFAPTPTQARVLAAALTAAADLLDGVA